MLKVIWLGVWWCKSLLSQHDSFNLFSMLHALSNINHVILGMCTYKLYPGDTCAILHFHNQAVFVAALFFSRDKPRVMRLFHYTMPKMQPLETMPPACQNNNLGRNLPQMNVTWQRFPDLLLIRR
jgi:hypothetical protein